MSAGNSGARNFDHGANFHFLARCRSLRDAVLLCTRPGPTARDAIHSRPEIIGNMIFTLPTRAGPKDRAQLGFEDVDVLETKTDRAPAEERI